MTDPKPPSDRDEQQEQKKWHERTRYQILLFVGGTVLFVLVVGWILDWYIEPKTSSQKKDLIQALGLLTAGVAGSIGIYMTWQGQRQAREAQEDNQRNTLKQLEQSRNELAINREGQITDRFTRAIDQLGKVDDKGNKVVEIRLGGIYALERIAGESEEDYWPIMEILTTYVRQHASWRAARGEQEGTEDAAVEKKSEEDPGAESDPAEVPSPDPDIQAILNVLRRTRYPGYEEPEALDLHKTRLSYANLQEAKLENADLWEADLRESDLRRANLRRAYLSAANLSAASLDRADLTGANLSAATLIGATLTGAMLAVADLTGADLTGANLSRANLGEADLTGANLTGAILAGADLTEAYITAGANLREADLTVANLTGAYFWRLSEEKEVDLTGAKLTGADLTGASFMEVDLTGAQLRDAKLTGAQLRDAKLTQGQLEITMGDETTELPSGLKPPAHWGVKTDEQFEED